MNESEALERVRRAGIAGRFLVAAHARQRMRERNVAMADVRHGLRAATRCQRQTAERWRVPTVDVDGDDSVAVAIEHDVVIVTVFRGGPR